MEPIITDRVLPFDDLLTIPQEHLPLIVLSDNVTSFIAWAIKHHEKGMYNHAMMMHRPGRVATQNWFFADKSIDAYRDAHRLKLWTNINWTQEERQLMLDQIQHDLNRSFFFRRYDLLGSVVGQGLNLPWIQIPWMRYCSESCSYYIELVDWSVPERPSPPELNRWFQNEVQYKCGYRVYGRYFAD